MGEYLIIDLVPVPSTTDDFLRSKVLWTTDASYFLRVLKFKFDK